MRFSEGDILEPNGSYREVPLTLDPESSACIVPGEHRGLERLGSQSLPIWIFQVKDSVWRCVS